MTRMWLTPPSQMCRQHLLGEHSELHMLVGHINAGNLHVVRGHAERAQVATRLIRPRHASLVVEMLTRGYNHASPLPAFTDPRVGSVDAEANRVDEEVGRAMARRRGGEVDE